MSHRRPMGQQIPRFLFVGGVATAVQYVVFALGLWLDQAPAALWSGIGYLVGSVVNYWLNRRLTFGSSQLHRHSIPRFYAMVGSACLLNAGLVEALGHDSGVSPWPAQMVATAVTLVYNFTVSRTWVFGTPSNPR